MNRTRSGREPSTFPCAFFCTGKVHNTARGEHGHFLIELVVAIGISSIVLAASCQAYSQIHQVSKATQNQTIAAHIAQQLMDNARNQRFADLQREIGLTRSLIVNGTGQPPVSAVNQRPLLLDLSTLQYQNYSLDGTQIRGNIFRGTVQQTVTDLGQGLLRVTVVVTWPSERPGSARTLQMNTVVSQYGTHN